jgi:outer membrane protein TolC
MRRTFIITLLALFATAASAQLTFEECCSLARDNYPLVKKYNLLELSRDYDMSNAAKGFLPQVSVSAGGYGFTDILDMPGQLSSTMGDMKNYMFNGNVTVNQTIYDGGAIASRKRMTAAQTDVEKAQLDVTLYDINSRIEQLFFGILTIDVELQQNRLLQNDLQTSLNNVESMIKGGVANTSDADAVKVNIIQTQQNEGSLNAVRHAYLTMLGTFIGRSLADSVTLKTPEMKDANTLSADNCRPELDFFTARGRLLDEQRRSLDTMQKPKLSAFGLALYHSNVSSLMKNQLFAGGVTLSWNIGWLYTRKNDIRKIEAQRAQIDADRETFLLNTNISNESTNGSIANLQQQIKLDDSIIALRQSIRDKAEKKVRNGIETVNELIRDINAVSQSRQTKALHEVQMLKEIYNLKITNNN